MSKISSAASPNIIFKEAGKTPMIEGSFESFFFFLISIIVKFPQERIQGAIDGAE